MKVEHEMYDPIGNIWSHPNSNKMFKEKFGSYSKKTFDRFRTKDSCTKNNTRNAVQQSENSNMYFDRRVMRKREAYLWRNLLLIGRCYCVYCIMLTTLHIRRHSALFQRNRDVTEPAKGHNP
jgi:hypothetical protein